MIRLRYPNGIVEDRDDATARAIVRLGLAWPLDPVPDVARPVETAMVEADERAVVPALRPRVVRPKRKR